MRVILVERRSRGEFSKMRELVELASTLGHEVVATVEQVREPDPAYHIGKGKVAELVELVKSKGAERVIFGNQLTPSQAFKLSEMLGVGITDRFQLILEIFAMRAGSREAKLQVEYARLKYELPRIRESIRIMRLREQPGWRGGGEYEVDVRYDAVKRRLANLRRKLASVAMEREQRRKLRKKKGFKLVALAGYTNAGKSTLMNSLTSARVPVDDMMFTTLMPRTKAIKTAPNEVLLTDTVGFIDGLPPWMVEAFKATLEEIYLADLVLLVIDVSEPIPEILRKLLVSREILVEYPVRVLTLFNKIDLISPPELNEKLEVFSEVVGEALPISAMFGTNLGSVVDEIREAVKGLS